MRVFPDATPSVFRLLFLCGYQRASRDVLDGLLHERGLARLLMACQGLEERVALTVAVPLLREHWARSYLVSKAKALCPSLRVDFVANGDPHALLAESDLFVFPYAVEHEVFVPTSLLEAMMVGVPAVASDRRMYRSLTLAGGVARCELALDDSVAALHEALRRVLDDYPMALKRAIDARTWCTEHWSIQHAADELLRAVSGAVFDQRREA